MKAGLQTRRWLAGSGGAALLFAVCAVAAERKAAAPPGDTDAKIIETVRPRFPVNLQQQGVVSGEVTMMLEIDPKGHLVDYLVTAATRREFTREAVVAVNAWRFEPAQMAGQNVSAVVPLTILFEFNGIVARVRQFDEPRHREANYEYQSWAWNELDRAPKLLWTVSPQYPKQLIDRGITGRVALDFYVDETGRVRFPVARASADPQLAAFAINALKVWTFDPPIRHGEAVLARGNTSFLFEPETKP